MRGNHVVHGVARDSERGECLQQPRHGMVGAGVDESRPAAVHEEIGRVEAVAMEAGVDGVHAMAERLDERWECLHGGGTRPWRRASGAGQRALQLAQQLEQRGLLRR